MLKKTKKESKTFKVQASSLPTHQDCPRRWAARAVKEVGESFELAPRGIGALIGERCHAGAARMLLAKQLQGEWNFNSAYEEQVEELKKNLKNEIIWDSTTKNSGVAIKQLEKMLFEFNRSIMPGARPQFIEMKERARWSEYIWLVGQSDYIEIKGVKWAIEDQKFSSTLSSYHSQFGCYKTIHEAQDIVGADEEVDTLILNWIPRVGEKTPQPPVLRLAYNVDACINASERQLEIIEPSVKKYFATGDPWCFNANANSKYCGRSTCEAWGTKWCDQWIELDKDKET